MGVPFFGVGVGAGVPEEPVVGVGAFVGVGVGVLVGLLVGVGVGVFDGVGVGVETAVEELFEIPFETDESITQFEDPSVSLPAV